MTWDHLGLRRSRIKILQTVKFKSEANQLGRTKCTVHAILKSNSVVCGYSNDIGMSFILEQVHFISMYFSVFVYTIPNLGIVLAPDCTICDFQSGTQFGMTKQTFIQCKSFRTEFQIENCKSCSLGQVAHSVCVSDWKPHEWECPFWASRFYHVNVLCSPLWN